MNMNQKNSSLISLRHDLHRKPELSGKESDTSKIIIRELEKYKPDRIINNVGGHGVVAIFETSDQKPDKTILFRAELDALPVHEETDLEYQSDNRGVMHACGHDGHMAILIGLAGELYKNRPNNVRVILLFQPAEETGEGAQKVLNDSGFKPLEIEHGFALHNLPGFDENSLYIRSKSFASASVGVEVSIKGKSSHAAYSEQGINPSKVIANLIQKVSSDFEDISEQDSNSKYAVTFIKMGERAFGMSPGVATIGFTFRSETDEALNERLNRFEVIVQNEAGRFSGEISTRRVEPFVATINSHEGCEIVRSVAKKLDIRVEELERPFPWSEDFGRFGEKFPITLIGLGSGKDSAPLHSEKYDFNDALLPAGISLFQAIIDYYSDS
jgi:amidohydrolase